MADRPCKPDADLKRLWRMLLPGTPFPACGVPKELDDTAGESVGSGKIAKDENAELKGKRGAGAR
jgi:hypothetical protein